MTLAESNPNESRAEQDLGRFGLGLKTASLSQCRQLTLVTKKDGVVSGFEWDLDYLASTGSWDLLELSKNEINDVPFSHSLGEQESGTLVLWRVLDRLPNDARQLETEISALMAQSLTSLGMVFHRFLAGQDGLNRLKIHINGRSVEAVDPFFSKNGLVQRGIKEVLPLEGGQVLFQSHTLPPLNKLSIKERAQIEAQGGLYQSQGFYIYRANRLVSTSGWMRLKGRQNLSRLTRVQVDIPQSLDHAWDIDIKKSRAKPPLEVREHLRKLVQNFTQASERIHTFRGWRTVGEEYSAVWHTLESQEAFTLSLNLSHPVVEKFANSLDSQQSRAFQSVISLLAENIPAQDIYVLMTKDREPAKVMRDPRLVTQLRSLISAGVLETGINTEEFVRSIVRVEPWTVYEHHQDELVEALEFSNEK